MNPNVCYNPHFRTPAKQDNKIQTLQLQFQSAIEVLKKSMKDKEITPPIIIEGYRDCTFVIKDYIQDGKPYFLIYRNLNSNDSPLIKIPKDRFYHVHFININDCRIFVMTKLIRAYFYRCNNTQISIREPIIGMIELFQSKNRNLHIRIQETLNGESPIPLTRIEECETISLYQSNTDIIYLVKLSNNIKGIIVDYLTKERMAQYDMGKLLWDSSEQHFICLSKINGFAMVPYNYVLNDIQHHIITKNIDETDDMDIDEDMMCLGTTPK